MCALGGRFGAVDKATFTIATKQKSDGKWESEGPYPVLFNPSSLKVSATTQVKREEGVANEKTPETAAADGKILPRGIGEQQVDITLIFNIVEEYNAKTDGVEFKALATAATSIVTSLIGSGDKIGQAESALSDLIKKTDFTSLSLFNEDLCCYTPLMTAAHKQVPVIFTWGNMAYKGIITKIQTTFNYFSSQGAPLGAEVSLSMVTKTNADPLEQSDSTSDMLKMVEKAGKFLRSLPI